MRSGVDAPAAGGGRGRWRLLAVAIAVLASAVVLAACGGGDDNGSSDSSGSSGSSGGSATSTPSNVKKPTGEPIKAMSIAAVNWNGPAYPNILETAKLYEKYINDRGGIAGRPLEVQTCDEQGDPNQLAACGRKAISDGVVAVVGSFTLTGDRIVPILENGKTAWWGICCTISPAEANNPITFNFGPQAMVGAAYAQKAVEMGCKKPALLVLDLPGKNLEHPTQRRVLAAAGITDVPAVAVPVASADYAPQVAQATSNGTDCIIGGLAENNWASFMPAFAQSGSDARLIGAQGNLDEKVGKPFASTVEGDKVIGYYPDISDKAFADYREAIAQYHPPTDGIDYNSLGGLGTWTAYVGFKNMIEKMSGPIDHSTFIDAANKETNLTTGGKIPPLDFTKPWKEAPYGYTRMFNTAVTYSEFGPDGKLKVEKPGFFDIKQSALEGAGTG